MHASWRNLGFLLLLTPALARPAAARQDPAAPPDEPAGVQVLTQGPIHEAFAQPVLFDPKAGPVIPKQPPPPIQELPPDQKPEGDNVQWIPGYWDWDDERNDYVWVSGVWRAIPPGRQWVPGYWYSTQGGFQWVPGYWGVVEPDAGQVDYLPAPPASLEQGPSSPAPSPEATWAPGIWVWQDNQYLWRPGFWVQNQPGWMWNPAQYAWTPSGYVYSQGYWDYPLANRGVAFAPVYFPQQAYSRPNFQYTPSVGLLASGLLSSLFVRPAYHQYAFGDYYAANNFQRGIYPWYSFHQSRYGYDPLYAYSAAHYGRTDPQWAQRLHETYDYRRAHADARPPRTFAETRHLAARPAGDAGRPAGAAPAVLARSFNQMVANPPAGAAGNAPAMKFQRIDQARRQEFAKRSAQVHQFREERQRREVQAAKTPRPEGKPQARRVEFARSPIATPAAPRNRPDGDRPSARPTPPAAPAHPHVERNIKPPPAQALPIRHDPSPNTRPPHAPGAGHPPGRRPEGRPDQPTPPASRPNPGPGPGQPGRGRGPEKPAPATPAPAPGPGPGPGRGRGPGQHAPGQPGPGPGAKPGQGQKPNDKQQGGKRPDGKKQDHA